MRSFFRLNRDIFLRTLCLVAVTVFFTSQGAREGEIVLAVNTLLMQLFTLFSYVMDGFAYAAEALTGRYIGAGNDTSFRRLVRVLFAWGAGLSATFTFVYAISGESFLGILTDEQTVLVAARDYFAWAVAIPVAGVAAFISRLFSLTWSGPNPYFLLISQIQLKVINPFFIISCSSSIWKIIFHNFVSYEMMTNIFPSSQIYKYDRKNFPIIFHT